MNKQIITKWCKRIFNILILLCICLSTNAQIQRTFFGFSFGCSKQVAIQKMKTLGYNIQNTDEGFIAESKINNNIKFGGYTWNFVEFKFYKNSFYNICFCSSSYTNQSKRMSLINYKELKNKLNKKYSQCHKDDWGVAGVGWRDSKTGLICRYLYMNNRGETAYQDAYDKYLNLYLWYYDKKTTGLINKSENNEL
nr:MAG TPA: hypothetical protein [Crassvirales sp.]